MNNDRPAGWGSADDPFEHRDRGDALDQHIISSISSVEAPSAGSDFWTALDRRLDLVDGARGSADHNEAATFDVVRRIDEPVTIFPEETAENGDRRGRALFLAAAVVAVLAIGLGLVLIQGQVFEAEPAEQVPRIPEPSVLEAEDMATKTSGEGQVGVWQIWRPGHIEDIVVFPADGTYEFVVVAKGAFEPGVEFGPDVEVLVDFVTVDTAQPVKVDVFAEYRFVGRVEAGTRRVAISNAELSNQTTPGSDEYGSPDLIVDRIEIRPVEG